MYYNVTLIMIKEKNILQVLRLITIKTSSIIPLIILA